MMEQLRGKVGFNYATDRKTDFRPGQKSAITRAYNDFKALKSAQFFKPRKQPGESKRAYNRRIHDLKEKYGQGDQKLRGLFFTVPSNAEARFVGGDLVLRSSDPDRQQFREIYVPVSPDEVAENLGATIEQIVFEYQPQVITPLHTAFRGSKGKQIYDFDGDIDEESLEDFIEDMEDLAQAYKGNPNALTGFIVRVAI